jgi:anaerobic selenocysteine-containing dehydrogenase
MREAVHLLGNAARALILTARGAEQHATGTDTVTAFINLALDLGLPGRAGSGFGCLTGQGLERKIGQSRSWTIFGNFGQWTQYGSFCRG